MYKRYAADKKNKKNSINKCMVTGMLLMGKDKGWIDAGSLSLRLQ
jgi:hypothetical protein